MKKLLRHAARRIKWLKATSDYHDLVALIASSSSSLGFLSVYGSEPIQPRTCRHRFRLPGGSIVILDNNTNAASRGQRWKCFSGHLQKQVLRSVQNLTVQLEGKAVRLTAGPPNDLDRLCTRCSVSRISSIQVHWSRERTRTDLPSVPASDL